MRLSGLPIAQIRHKPLLALLPILLFSLGVGLLLLMARLDYRLSDTLERNLAGVDLVLGAKGSPLQLILSSLYHADNPTGNITLGDIRPYLNQRHPIIESALPIATGDNYRGFRIVGSDPGIINWYDLELASGQNMNYSLDVVLGASTAEALQLRLGDTFVSTHGLDAESDHQHTDAFTVVGILKPSSTIMDQLILTPIPSYWQTHGHPEESEHVEHDHSHGHDHVHVEPVWYEAADDRTITALLLRYRGMNHMALNFARTINEKTILQAAAPNIEIGRLYALTGNSLRLARYVSYVIVIVSALSLFISLFTVLHARIKELALLRGLGARPFQLFGLVIGEGLIVAALGVLGGLLLSRILEQLISDRLASLGSAPGWISAESVIILGALAIALLAAAVPAWMASRVEVAEEL